MEKTAVKCTTVKGLNGSQTCFFTPKKHWALTSAHEKKKLMSYPYSENQMKYFLSRTEIGQHCLIDNYDRIKGSNVNFAFDVYQRIAAIDLLRITVFNYLFIEGLFH